MTWKKLNCHWPPLPRCKCENLNIRKENLAEFIDFTFLKGNSYHLMTSHGQSINVKFQKKGFVISYLILRKTILLTALKTITHVFLQNNIRQKDTTDVVQNCFFSQLMCLVTIISLIYNHNVILPLIEKVGH